LGGRKGIWPVKNLVVGCWCGYQSGARCRLAYGPADAVPLPLTISCSSKSRLVIHFWYQIVPDIGPLKGVVVVVILTKSKSFSHVQFVNILAEMHLFIFEVAS